VYGALSDTERQKRWLLASEEAIGAGGDDLMHDYFKVVTKLTALYNDLQVRWRWRWCSFEIVFFIFLFSFYILISLSLSLSLSLVLVIFSDLQDFEEAAEWAHNAAVTMEEIYLKSQLPSDMLQYAVSYFNYSFYSAYSGQLTMGAKWFYFARDVLFGYFLFQSQTLDVIKSRALYLANVSLLPDALMGMRCLWVECMPEFVVVCLFFFFLFFF
jgi:hypothetical protein